MIDEADRIWSEIEIEDFVKDVYSYTWGDGKTQFIYREQRKKRFGKQYFTITNTVITDALPFSDPKTDKLILLRPDLEALLRQLGRVASQKVPKGLTDQ